jgi:DNA-binding transcriptional LysR family regulator
MSDLPSRLLYRERYVVAVRPQHPLARRAAMTIVFLKLRSRSCVANGRILRGPTDRALARLQLRRTVRYSVSSFLLMPELLQTDDLVALVPSRLLRENSKRLVVLKPPVEVPRWRMPDRWRKLGRQSGTCWNFTRRAV